MVNTSLSTQGVPYGGPLEVALSRPPPQPRVVENVAHATLRQYESSPAYGRLPSALEELAYSARQFAELLDSTGSVAVASSISGLPVGGLDVYA